MRLLHIADLHLGRQFHGLSLEADHGAILDQVIDTIATHSPDVLIIAGDVFDRAAPPASAVRQFNDFMRRVAQFDKMAVVIIAGNHDSGDRIEAMSVITDPARALIRGALLAQEPALVLNDAHGPVAISALPFGYEYAARECFDDPSIATPADVIAAQVAAARAQVPSGARWIIVAHGFVAGAQNSESERPLARVGGIETVPSAAFDGAAYVALGHLHRPQTAGGPHIRYSGAPLAFGFDEGEGEAAQKSMTLVDLGARDVVTTLVPFRPLRHVRSLRGPLDDILRAAPSDDFIKVILTDATPHIEPMKRLRRVFPNACQLSYARDERALATTTPAMVQTLLDDPIAVTDAFLKTLRDVGLAPAERKLVEGAINALRRAGDAP